MKTHFLPSFIKRSSTKKQYHSTDGLFPLARVVCCNFWRGSIEYFGEQKFFGNFLACFVLLRRNSHDNTYLEVISMYCHLLKYHCRSSTNRLMLSMRSVYRYLIVVGKLKFDAKSRGRSVHIDFHRKMISQKK